MEKIKVFFITLAAWFRALTWAKVWEGVKKALNWIWSKLCALLKSRYGAPIVLMVIGLYMGATHSKFSFDMISGTVIFFLGVWYLIQETNE
jgi:hypothetical protein